MKTLLHLNGSIKAAFSSYKKLAICNYLEIAQSLVSTINVIFIYLFLISMTLTIHDWFKLFMRQLIQHKHSILY